MPTSKERPAAVAAAAGAEVFEQAFGSGSTCIKDCHHRLGRSVPPPCAPIHAKLIGDDVCATAGIAARGHTPILTLCRRLIEAGHDPRTPLEAWRGTTLCLRISNISAGSRLTVKERPFGPVFEHWMPFSTPPVSPPVAPTGSLGRPVAPSSFAAMDAGAP